MTVPPASLFYKGKLINPDAWRKVAYWFADNSKTEQELRDYLSNCPLVSKRDVPAAVRAFNASR